MYYVEKRIEVAMAHRLCLTYESKCSHLHGHNAIVTVYCKSETLNENGMVVDFSTVKDIVKGLLDHQYVNDKVDFNPTAENLARWICEQVPNCYKVTFQESRDNIATYEKE
ncbi:MAG: 6-carboxytetrahydropterin synthase [Bacteroidaceae bacterium]|nr:6-carboxytetrahydropterin synthase [Bacteroidaceae bacterium]